MKTKVIEVHSHFPELKDIAYCAKVIRDGGLVIFPTETVYGIAADFNNPKAMKKLREVKGRADDKPISVLVSNKSLISNYTSSIDQRIYKIIDAFWPGPLTIVVPAKEEGTTIGVRMPDNEIALRLVQESQCTFAAPSANKEGEKPPLTCQEALKDLDGLIDIAIDGGPVNIGRGSVVVDCSGEETKLLRDGVISLDDINKVIERKTVLFVCTGNSCRSVMGEYLLRERLKGREDVEIQSAGTGVFIRSSASGETISVLRDDGIDATPHVSQPLNTILLKKSDLIFCMTRAHRDQVLERVPTVEKRIYLLREFCNIPADFHGSLDIPDPIGRSNQEYKECAAIIKEAVDKIVELV